MKILGIVSKYVSPDDILVLTCVTPPVSSDIDIYCITKNTSSSIHMFYDQDGVWNELFVDNIADTYNKLQNVDEIIVNFLLDMDFIYGNKLKYETLQKEAERVKNKYKLPQKRKDVVRYRIKVLSSKYFNPIKPVDSLQQHFLLNSLNYYLVQLILENYHIFPSSPKKWILQLKEKLPKQDLDVLENLIKGQISSRKLKQLVNRYTMDLKTIDIDKSKDNKITFIS